MHCDCCGATDIDMLLYKCEKCGRWVCSFCSRYSCHRGTVEADFICKFCFEELVTPKKKFSWQKEGF